MVSQGFNKEVQYTTIEEHTRGLRVFFLGAKDVLFLDAFQQRLIRWAANRPKGFLLF